MKIILAIVFLVLCDMSASLSALAGEQFRPKEGLYRVTTTFNGEAQNLCPGAETESVARVRNLPDGTINISQVAVYAGREIEGTPFTISLDEEAKFSIGEKTIAAKLNLFPDADLKYYMGAMEGGFDTPESFHYKDGGLKQWCDGKGCAEVEKFKNL